MRLGVSATFQLRYIQALALSELPRLIFLGSFLSISQVIR